MVATSVSVSLAGVFLGVVSLSVAGVLAGVVAVSLPVAVVVGGWGMNAVMLRAGKDESLSRARSGAWSRSCSGVWSRSRSWSWSRSGARSWSWSRSGARIPYNFRGACGKLPA